MKLTLEFLAGALVCLAAATGRANIETYTSSELRQDHLGSKSGHENIEDYSYSGPVNGTSDVGLNPGGGYLGAIESHFGNISESVYYNPVAQTIEEVGTLTVTPYMGSFDMTRIFGSPSTVGSATLTVGNNGVVSFDTIFSADGGGFYSGLFDLPVSGQGNYNGQSFDTTWNIELPMTIDLLNSSQNSLTFTQSPNGSGSPFGSVFGSPVIDGLWDGAGGDNTIHYSWLQESVVARISDEASSLFLSGLSVLSLAIFRRRCRGSAKDCEIFHK
jgi:hypothetical protein